MSQIKQSTAFTKLFLMVSSTDHVTAVTGITPTVTLSKAGAAFGAAAGTVTEIANGWYKVVYTTVDVNTFGELAGHATGTGADPTDWSDQVVAYDPSAATNLGLTNLDAAISTRGTSSYAGADTSGTTTLLTRIPGTVTAQTGDAFARIGPPAGASVSADLAAVAAKTSALSATPAADVVTAMFAHLVETGVTFQQFCEIVGAVLAGNATAAGAIKAIGNPSTPRASAVLDGTGNRTMTLTP